MPAARISDERFHSLFAEHHDAIQAFCLRRLPIDDANEAAADVFIVAWRRIGDVPEGDAALPWLYGVARNVARNHQRGWTRRLRLVAKAGAAGAAPVEGPETRVIRSAEHDEVTQALAKLRDADQELLRLKSWERLSNKAIGAILGISEQAVESRYARALARLARKLPNRKTGHVISPLSSKRGEKAL